MSMILRTLTDLDVAIRIVEHLRSAYRCNHKHIERTYTDREEYDDKHRENLMARKDIHHKFK